MTLFSQRKGIKPVKSIIQVDSMDDALRNSLWNVLSICYWYYLKRKMFVSSSNRQTNSESELLLPTKIWLGYFKWPIDTLPDDWELTYEKIRKYYFNCEWYEVYDFIEYVANQDIDYSGNQQFINLCNKMLEREVSAYRFVGTKVVQMTSEVEISEIEQALEGQNYLKSVDSHLKQALNLLADRKSPDYRNSIKESILAVEAICQLITGNTKTTLGQALKQIENKVSIHPALKDSFSKLYGYTSDADGIRHALLDESKLKFEDAKFILVSCSAFINYLKSKASTAGINL